MNIDTSDYYPWGPDRKRPAEQEQHPEPTLTSAPVDDATSESPLSITEAPDAAPEESQQAHPDPTAVNSTTPLGLSENELPEQETPQAPKGSLTNLSHLLSLILSPVVTPTLGIIAVFQLSMYSYAPAATKWLIVGIVFSLTCVIPCAAIWVLTKFGDVSDMALTRRSDRLIPYIITGACLLACGYYLTRTGLPLWVGYFYIGAAAATLINLLINFRWKISAHGAGIGGLIAMLMILNRYGLPSYNLWGWVVAAIIAAGLLGAARVWLWRHTPMQTICGELVGFLGVILTESFVN